MAASIQWSESNGAGESVTDGISNLNFGSTDAVNIVVASYPVTAGGYSYEKNIRLKFGGTFTEISNMKLWKSAGVYVTDEDIHADVVASYVQPVATVSSRAITTIPTSVGTAITVLAANGSATIVAAGYTRYICFQLQTSVSTPSGSVNQKTITMQWDEV